MTAELQSLCSGRRRRWVVESGQAGGTGNSGSNGVGWAGWVVCVERLWEVGGGGALLITRVLLFVQMYFLISAFTCGFCLFSSWIISVSGLQHILHLLHGEFTKDANN